MGPTFSMVSIVGLGVYYFFYSWPNPDKESAKPTLRRLPQDKVTYAYGY